MEKTEFHPIIHLSKVLLIYLYILDNLQYYLVYALNTETYIYQKFKKM